MRRDRLLEKIVFTKYLVDAFSKREYISPYLRFKFIGKNEVRIIITKLEEALPFKDYFDMIIINDDNTVEIVDIFYSVRDEILNIKSSRDIRETLFNEKTWTDPEKLKELEKEFPKAFILHNIKANIIKGIQRDMANENIKELAVVIDGEGRSCTVIKTREGIKSESMLVYEILSAIELLMQVYKQVYKVDDQAFRYDEEARQQNYRNIIMFLNIVTEIIQHLDEDIDIRTLFVNPIYKSRETIFKIEFFKNNLKNKVLLEKEDDNKFELIIISRTNLISYNFTTIDDAIKTIKELMRVEKRPY